MGEPSEAAVKSTARTLKLLGENFDPAAGRYAEEWSDQRIADETGLSRQAVCSYRRECFGELKEDPEIEQLQIEIIALEREVQTFVQRTNASVAEMKGRLLRLQREAEK